MSPANLILPVFIHEGDQNVPIASMPGVDRLTWKKGLPDKVREARSYGVNSVVLFPKVAAKQANLSGYKPPHACKHSLREGKQRKSTYVKRF